MDLPTETPIVGVNTGTLPSNPWGVFDLLFGLALGTWLPLTKKYRKGDCFAYLLNASVGAAGTYVSWDKAWPTDAMSIIKFVLTGAFDFKQVLDAVQICNDQYYFSVANPWINVFFTKGKINPYKIGKLARRKKYAQMKQKPAQKPAPALPDTHEVEIITEVEVELAPEPTFQPEVTLDETVEELDDWADEEDGDDDEGRLENFEAVNEAQKALAQETKMRKWKAVQTKLPYGSEQWLYSEWNYSSKMEQFTVGWWVALFVTIVKIVLNGYKFFLALESKFYFFDQGKYFALTLWTTFLLIDGLTDLHWIKAMKPWYRWGNPIPKPVNYKKLENRPVQWASLKKANKDE